jgi:hypothetical protein
MALGSLCDNGPSYFAMIVKCFLALQCGVQPLILPDVPSSKEEAFMTSQRSRITYCKSVPLYTSNECFVQVLERYNESVAVKAFYFEEK